MGQDLSAVGDCNVVADKTKHIYWDRKKQLIYNMKRSVNSSKKILNIAVLGLPGCGKSSFINTAITSLREDKWNQYSIAGKNSQNVSSITQHFRSFRASCYFEEEPHVYFPTFIDVNGLEDNEGGFNEAFLRALFDGRIIEGEDLTELFLMFDNNADRVIEEMSQRPKYLKIDRIIVVTSGDPNVTLPNNLFKCIRKVANSFGGIPIFGVMTKKDRFKQDEQIPGRIDDFLCNLGINENSFKWIENYCPDVDNKMTYHWTVFPSIDVPVLCFLTQVINSHLRPYDPLDDRPCLLKRISINVLEFVCYFIQIAILLHWSIFFKIVTYQHKKKDFCAEYETLIKYYNLTLPTIDNICNEISNFEVIISIIVSISVFLFTFCISTYCRKLMR